VRRERARRLVAFLGHAPALWLVYRERLPRRIIIANAVAAAGTLAAVFLATRRSPRPLRAAALAWAAGHVAWGTLLAAMLPRRSPMPGGGGP
jgi:drug/metabolite transporter (DMT)-like permease